MPMMRAGIRREYPALCGVRLAVLNWPMPALQLRGRDSGAIIDAADKITAAWDNYSDEALGIYAFTNGEKHNTITPIMRMDGEEFVLELVLRNNITSPERPLGVFHPHPCRHHIKKENIGLIEVMGLFILPGRLKEELEQTARYLSGMPFDETKAASHIPWADSFRDKYDCSEPEKARAALRQELAVLCVQLLGDAAVFKDDEAGRAGLDRFVNSLY